MCIRDSIKAIITGDIDKQEQLGIYEVSPEDFAVAEFVDSSKLELQKIVRELSLIHILLVPENWR